MSGSLSFNIKHFVGPSGLLCTCEQRLGGRQERDIQEHFTEHRSLQTCSFPLLHNTKERDLRQRGSRHPQWDMPLHSLLKISPMFLCSGQGTSISYSLLHGAVSHRNTTCLPPHSFLSNLGDLRRQ